MVNFQLPYPPVYQERSFNCPHCGAYAQQTWNFLTYQIHGAPQGGFGNTDFAQAACGACGQASIWYTQRHELVYPLTYRAYRPNPDLPEEIQEDFNEAADIVARSPRGAAALLRLVVEKLLLHLNLPGRDINDKIGKLVKQGLPPQVQQALDAVRVIGNNAVHPGEMAVDDTPEVAHSLFETVNYLADALISQPKRLSSLYAGLPQNTREAIERRDNGQQKTP